MRTAIVRIAIAAALLLSSSARAEEAWVTTPTYRPHQTLFLVNWEIAGPIGSFGDYIDDTSLRGGSIEFRSFVSDKVSLGLSFSWNRFDQTFDLVTAPITNGTASGPVFRYADMFGVRGLAHYYLTQGQLQPYLGVGIGGAWSYAYQQVADLSDTQENFNFIVDPEVGVLYWLAKGGTTAALNLAFRYTYTTATVGREHDAQTLSGIVGFAFGY
jgi:outer membrane protein W